MTDTFATTQSRVGDRRLTANRENAKKSTGPNTEDGKNRSRFNALKHGLTGAGIVLPAEMQAEVKRRPSSGTARSSRSTVGSFGSWNSSP